jgi:hypothetical protein
MTKTLRFYGASDDLFECDCDEDRRFGGEQCNSAAASTMAWAVRDETGAGLIVTGQYAPNNVPGGTWVIGVTLLDEDVSLPPWPMRFENGPINGHPPSFYSPALVIEAPDSVTVATPAQG